MKRAKEDAVMCDWARFSFPLSEYLKKDIR